MRESGGRFQRGREGWLCENRDPHNSQSAFQEGLWELAREASDAGPTSSQQGQVAGCQGARRQLFGGWQWLCFPVPHCTTVRNQPEWTSQWGQSCVCSVHNESSHHHGQSHSTNDQPPCAGKRTEGQARRGEASRWIPVPAS